MDYAQQLAGGKALELRTTPQGNIWFTKLTDGTTINVRDFSTSGVGRWTIDVQNESSFRPLVNRDKVEMKFK